MQIGFLGFGEAGSTFTRTLLAERTLSIVTYDRLLDDPATRASLLARAKAVSASCVDSPTELAQSTQYIFSTVTADQSQLAIESLAPALTPDHIVFDLNSVSPGKKKATAALVTHQGARYVDVAVMAPVHPRGHRTPLLVSGPDQALIEPVLQELNLSFTWKGPQIGDASVVKMLRSILIKGMESLISECVTAAEPLGVADEILESAGKTLGIADMRQLADYVMERVAVHGQRRSEEMREVAITLEELGVSNFMARAIAEHQAMIAALQSVAHFDGNVPQDRTQLATFFNAGQRDSGADA